ncbi:MAG: SipW-dependent-type signal peptide-containing protein [Candidatus Paceibacterota bacterium]
MKKIILSLSMIAVVGVVVLGATGAFFSDTETSTGNTFTAGAIDLKVDSEQHYNGNVCQLVGSTGQGNYQWVGSSPYPVPGSPCDGTWTLTDLQNGVQKFFNFADIKPGDEGENTISLHVINNDAWACVDVNITKNDDVSSNEPELAAGDTANTDSIFDGELAQNIKFAAWADDGDNIWESPEPLLFSNQSGPASDVLGGKTYTLADSSTGPLVASSTRYIGLAWCAGTQAIVGNTITCNGAGMGNNTQTDSMVASIAFRVEQARNNAGFRCSTATQTNPHALRLENETIVEGGPWTIINDGTYADLAWAGDGNTFDYTLTGKGLAASTAYSLIYYADGWPGNNPGAFIGTHTTDGSGNIVAGAGNPNLGVDLPTLPDGNFTNGAKIWLVRSSDYNSGSLSTGPMTAWNPSQYLFEGNVYINYNDTNN